MPMTPSGNAQPPPADAIHDRVEGRQQQEAPAAREEHPARRPDALDHGADAQLAQPPAERQGDDPGDANQITSSQGVRSLRSTPPAISPRIIVASVGMKLSVA